MQERVVRKILFRYRHYRYVYGIRRVVVLRRLEGFFAEQVNRLPLWFVAAWVMGAAFYFTLSVEPAGARLGLGVVVGSTIIAACWYGAPTLRSLWTFVGTLWLGASIGVLLASVHVSIHQQTRGFVLTEESGVVNFQAQVVSVNAHRGGWRFLLKDVVVWQKNKEPMPLIDTAMSGGDSLLSVPSPYVRLSMRGLMDTSVYQPGQKITGRGRFYPPSPPVYPGGYDFSRRAWFHGISAFGYSLGAVNVSAQDDEVDAGAWLVRLRQGIERNIATHISGEEGRVATALLVGQRGRLSDNVWRIMRTSGLAHLLALSGLHMGLVAGFMFFLFWRLLSLSRMALDYNIRKAAALAAMLASLFYLLLTGGSLPTVRAFVMVAFVLLAIILDRRPFSLFVVAWAAAGIVLFDPYAVVDVSFQMSFAAVVALAAFYEHVSTNRALDEPTKNTGYTTSLWQTKTKKVGLYMGGVAMTTLVASMATMPFISYHFQQVAPYGLLANMVAVPLTALWIMPSGILAMVASAVGLEGIFFEGMAIGIALLLDWASFIAALPSAYRSHSAYPTGALACFVMAGLWLCLWQRGRIAVAAVLCGVAVVIIESTPQPDIFIHRDGSMVAVRDASQPERWLFSSQHDRWYSRQWLQSVGGVKQSSWDEATATSGLTCDGVACLYDRRGLRVSFVFEPSAFVEDCSYADLVVVMGAWVVPPFCAARVISREELRKQGAASVSLAGGEDGLVIHYVADFVGSRPWSSF
ncbi:MAG: ComEC/Rec2 family competence protein [Alphaproteobacteria bacterium GM202ARS2]|nr:ComEC/Rec2 family competence protein [Alphaproteobacteria bacterium GM202ARS2]